MAKRKVLQALSALVHDAVHATVDLVGDGHASAHRGVQRVADAAGVGAPVAPISGLVEGSTKGSLASVKAVNRMVGTLTRLALDATAPAVEPDLTPVPLRSDVLSTPAWMGDAAVGALNGTVGDHLAATKNALDMGMRLRRGDAYLTNESITEPVLLLVHGLATTEWCWSMDAEKAFGDPEASYATLLGEDLEMLPLLARYNTGRRVADNGALLAEALEKHCIGAQRLVLVGHSMGGLVIRAACRVAEERGYSWLAAVQWVVSIGTPHAGAPLARFGATVNGGLSAIDTPATTVLGSVLGGRSAGVKDLEVGDLGPLVAGPHYAFFGSTLTADPEHPAGQWMGDLLVQSTSSGGPDEAGHNVVRELLGGIPHHRLQADARVLDALRALLVEPKTTS